MRIIGIGTDITECARIEKMVQRHGAHFLGHVFTDREAGYCSSKKRSSEHYAGRWAAKEAVLKALGTGWIGGISWKDVEVVNEIGGRPRIELSGGAQKTANRLGITEIQISISHCTSHAIAFAVAVGGD
ncbi:MAG: holo-ACP synthase [Planctomycetaceae bacterium]|nr:holo-ACP synthase [Planctomycetaceae bacterium]